MKKKSILLFACIVFFLMFIAVCNPAMSIAAKAANKAKGAKLDPSQAWAGKPKDAFNINKMGDMSNFDPAHWVHPTGDTIKIAYVNAFSGPGATAGNAHLLSVMFAAYDINQRGGIWVDGKKKLIDIIPADHMSKADQCKKICERMVLQEKVHFLVGTSGSQFMKIINEVGNKYKVISVNEGSASEDLMDAANFGRYSFMPTASTEQMGRAMAYYYGQIRKKEKKFYILCQDYSFGRGIAEGFKKGLKEYYPEAQIVGEDYHKLFLTDYAPYVEKIKASGAEVLYTGDWAPDSQNLLKQTRQMGVTIPVANIYLSAPTVLRAIGVEGTKGLVHMDIMDVSPAFKHPGYDKFYKTWNNLWKNKWKTAPFSNNPDFEHGIFVISTFVQEMYWMFSVIERAKTLNPEKIIKVWEGDTYQAPNGKVFKMRPCDHKAIQNFAIHEYVPPAEQKVSMTIPPYYWYDNACGPGPGYTIPADKILPWMDQKLDRCKGKSNWGE